MVYFIEHKGKVNGESGWTLYFYFLIIILLLVTCEKKRVKWENWRVKNGERQQGRSWPPNLTQFSQRSFSSHRHWHVCLLPQSTSSLATRTCALPISVKGMGACPVFLITCWDCKTPTLLLIRDHKLIKKILLSIIYGNSKLC